MLKFDIAAKVRQDFGKGAARSLRRSGSTPAILYGPGNVSLPLSLETKAFTKELLKIHGNNVVVGLEIIGDKENSKRHVMLKEIQKDPVHDTLVHADFYEISLDTPLTLPVPLRFVGVAKGIDMGGELHVVMDVVQVKGLPLDLPDAIEVDITSLEMGGPGITCGALNIPESVTIQEEAQKVCVIVAHPSMKAEEEAVESEESEAESAAEV